jgi:proline dehydrogenase
MNPVVPPSPSPASPPTAGPASSLSAPAGSTALAALSFEDTRVAFANKTTAQMQKARLLFASFDLPWLVRTGSAVAVFLLKLGAPGVGWLVRRTVFEQFCGGVSIPDCERAVEALGRFGVDSILDYSVEGEQSERGFDQTMEETLATLDWGKAHPHAAFGVFKVSGLARFELLEKLSAGVPLSAGEEAEWARARARVERICERAHALGERLFIDAEESWPQPAIDRLAEEMMARYNRERAIVYNTYQLYRRASLGNLEAALERAAAGGHFLGAKLVRGAYMEKERKRARERGYADPIQPDKAATDADYDRAVRFCLDHLERIEFCAGTHNEASCLALTEEIARRGLGRDDPRIWFSQLYGMSDNISFNLARAGFNVAKYMPYGPVRAVMPYLIRRAEENSAIAGQGGRELRLIQRELSRRKATT